MEITGYQLHALSDKEFAWLAIELLTRKGYSHIQYSVPHDGLYGFDALAKRQNFNRGVYFIHSAEAMMGNRLLRAIEHFTTTDMKKCVVVTTTATVLPEEFRLLLKGRMEILSLQELVNEIDLGPSDYITRKSAYQYLRFVSAILLLIASLILGYFAFSSWDTVCVIFGVIVTLFLITAYKFLHPLWSVSSG